MRVNIGLRYGPTTALACPYDRAILIQWLKGWDGRPARLFCFIRYGRDARATLRHDRTEHVDLGRAVVGPLLALGYPVSPRNHSRARLVHSGATFAAHFYLAVPRR